MKSWEYTQKQWDREIGWGKVPPEYVYDKDKVKNYDVQSQNSESTRTNDRDNKQEKILRNSRGK